jgi:hypothetical protein
MKLEQTQCSETSAIKHHTPENNPKGYTRHTEQDESLKSRCFSYLTMLLTAMIIATLVDARNTSMGHGSNDSYRERWKYSERNLS